MPWLMKLVAFKRVTPAWPSHRIIIFFLCLHAHSDISCRTGLEGSILLRHNSWWVYTAGSGLIRNAMWKPRVLASTSISKSNMVSINHAGLVVRDPEQKQTNKQTEFYSFCTSHRRLSPWVEQSVLKEIPHNPRCESNWNFFNRKHRIALVLC